MLYNKHLNNIEELRAERLALQNKSEAKKQELITKPEIKQNIDAVSEKILSLSNNLMGNSKYAPLISKAATVAVPIIVQQIKTKVTRKMAGKVASEIIFGYAKWKAISLAIGLISNKVKKGKKAK
jgi:hypothetical protein